MKSLKEYLNESLSKEDSDKLTFDCVMINFIKGSMQGEDSESEYIINYNEMLRDMMGKDKDVQKIIKKHGEKLYDIDKILGAYDDLEKLYIKRYGMDSYNNLFDRV